MKKNLKVLFVIKRRGYDKISYGLVNSCEFLKKALKSIKVEAEVVQVTDNNDIDREVANYKPTHVFIEALWVVPEKFDILLPLHPAVKWFVRIHSNAPFLSQEGMAFEWITKYSLLSKKYNNFSISSNSKLLTRELNQALGIDASYTPNIYKSQKSSYQPIKKPKNVLDVGCFGALRILKNQVEQALSAIIFAERNDKKLNFHVNFSRFETGGESIIKNLTSIFQATDHNLIQHEWMTHEDFLKVVKNMDIGLQVSMSETFNIVAADFVDNDIPLVGSKEIPWMHGWYQADQTNSIDVVEKMEFAYFGDRFNIQYLNKLGLENHNKKSLQIWYNLLYNDTNW